MHSLTICTILLISILQPSWTGDILNPPAVIQGGGSKTVTEGDTKSLVCIFRGSPQPAVTWKKDNVIVRSARNEYNSLFRITGATASDAGVYVCEGVNSEGTGSATFTLTVEPREHITRSQAILSTTTRTSGRSTSTSTSIKGTREIPTIPSNVILETDIVMTTPYYYVGSSNPVVYAPRGRTVELYCSVTNNGIQYTVEWHWGSTLVQRGGDTYRILNFGSNNAGSYTCTANGNGKADSSTMELRVGDPLRITSSPSSRYYTLGDALLLRVDFNRQSDCEVNWYRVKGNSTIPMKQGNGVYFQSNKKRMDINPLTVRYIGAYTVRVVCNKESASASFSINVYAAITTEQPSETTPFVEGSYINLPCSYYGYPTSVVKWYLNNEEANPSNSNKYNLSSGNILRVGPLGPNDNGNRIKCEVIQNDRRPSIVYTLEMGLPPKRVPPFNCNTTICVNSRVRLVSRAESESPLVYKWYRLSSSTYITTSSKHSVYSDGRLDIHNPNSNDIGAYVCEASNRFGVVYSICWVEYRVAVLSLVSSEQDVILTLGRRVSIYTRINGSFGATVRWYKDDNRVLPNDAQINTRTSGQITLSILSFPVVTTLHSGEYTCVVSVCDNEVKQTHRLRVRQNVEITVIPNKVFFCSGSTANFPCEATGFPQPEINWYFNGEIITSGEDGFQISGRNTLSVIDGPTDKTGYYTCNASNPFSRRTYTFRGLFLDIVPPTFGSTPPQLPVLGQDFCLSCLPTVSRVEYTYEWYKQSSSLSNSAKYDQSNEWQLCVSNFNLQDLGTYWCRVSNCAGTSRKSFSINAYQGQDVAPSITTTRALYRVIQGRTVRLFCNATGSPEPSISWYHEGILVSGGGHISLVELPSLRIDNVQRNFHNGAYECRASNREGTDTLSVEMVVYQPPKLIRIRSQRVDVGSTAYFNCSLTQGYPVPTRVWTKDGVEVVSQGRVSIDQNTYTLSISRLRGDDQGVYRCTASSTVGWAYVEATLQVRTCGQLRFTEIQLNHIVVDGNSLTVSCPIQPNFFECSMVIVWRELTLATNIVLKNIPRSDPRLIGDSLALQLDMDGTGLYQCEAYNEYSTIVQNHNVTVVAPPWVVTYLRQQIFRVNSEVSLNCPVRGIPPLSYIWLLEGTELVSGENILIENEQLTIKNAATSDTGGYSCNGSNLYGQREARFEVIICGPMTLEMTEDQAVEEKSRITFNCFLPGKINANSIEFFVGESRLTVQQLPAKRFTLRTNNNGAELRISTRVGDTGPVTCRVNTSCGTSEITRLLTVRPRQTDGLRVVNRLITYPGTVSPNCHNQFTLNCPIRGKPKPKYRWYLNNTRIAFNNPRVVSARGKKEITVIDPDINDAGNYRCNATNNQGRVSFTYFISVKLPRANSTYQKLVLFEGDNLNLTCKSDVPANREWSKDLVRLNGDNSGESSFVINGAQSSDEGIYFCCAKSGDNIYKSIYEVKVED